MLHQLGRWSLAAGLAVVTGGPALVAHADQNDQGGKGTMENAGSAAGKGLRSAGQTTENAMDTAGHSVGNAADTAGNTLGNAAEATGNAVSKAAHKTEKASGDASVTSAVKSKLAAEAPDATDINVDTKHGVVTLSGTVHTQAMREQAMSVARQTDGVNNVKNHLKVKASKD